MMKLPRICLLVLCLSIGSYAVSAQATGVSVRIDSVHYGMVGSADLTGFVTYSVLVDFTSSDDFLTAIYGVNDDGICYDPDWADVDINTDSVFFNVPDFGGELASEILCFAFDTFEEVQFDSYATIGMECNEDGGSLTMALICPTPPELGTTFNDNDQFFIDDGLIFALPGSWNGYSGANLQVEAFQLTSNGGISGCFNIQHYAGDDVTTSDTLKVCFDQPHPCINAPIDTTVMLLDTALCAGQVPLVQIGLTGAGNGDISFDLYADGVYQGTQVGNPQYPSLDPGVDYYWTMIDEVGCRDTSNVWSYVVPEALTFTAQVDEGVLCAGDSTGVISYAFSGGQVPYTIVANATDTLSLSGLAEDLFCGPYVITITDGNGCMASDSVNIACPAPILFDIDSTPIACSADCDGAVGAAASGGTGALEVLLYEAAAPLVYLDQQSGFAPVAVSADSLCAGDYVLYASDAQGCVVTDTLFYDAPNPLSLQVDSVVDILCGGQCDGLAYLSFGGGTGILGLTLDGIPTPVSDLEGLCALESSLVCVTDENACSACDSLTIVQNPPLEFLFDVDDATCIGQADGSIGYFAQGGVGELEVLYGPFDADLEALEGGSYSFTVTDSLGCELNEVIEVGYDVETDMTLAFNVTPVSCFDQEDGAVQAVVVGGEQPFEIVWNDPSSSTTLDVNNLAPGSYTVQITDAVGCVVDSSALVGFNPDCIFISTAITPNGDGFNDTWFIGGMDLHPNAVVQVYNRWGQLLFEESGYQDPWNGRFNGSELPIGDYYYFIDLGNGREPFTGTVTLKY